MTHEDKMHRVSARKRRNEALDAFGERREYAAVLTHAVLLGDDRRSLSPERVEDARGWNRGRVWEVLEAARSAGFIEDLKWSEDSQKFSFIEVPK